MVAKEQGPFLLPFHALSAVILCDRAGQTPVPTGLGWLAVLWGCAEPGDTCRAAQLALPALVLLPPGSAGLHHICLGPWDGVSTQTQGWDGSCEPGSP